MSLTLDELRGRALARQFPARVGADPTELLRLLGPIQSQTARSPFLGLVARGPSVTAEGITQAYEANRIVRGSTLRGTVHTADAATHRTIDAATRVGQRTLWTRTLCLSKLTLDEVWAAQEAFATDSWRTVTELAEHLESLLRTAGEGAAADALANQAGRYMSFGHGGLIRRPATGGWEGQGQAVYRDAATLLGLPLPTAEQALPALVRDHVRRSGPVSRHDLAWWAGLGLRAVDAAISACGDDLITDLGPDGRDYVDVPDAPPPIEVPGALLLPEFDALMCAYDPHARDRFVTPEHHAMLWNARNGLMMAPLLLDGRITGRWRLIGNGRRRELAVEWFAGTRRPRRAELSQPIEGLQGALGIEVDRVRIHRA